MVDEGYSSRPVPDPTLLTTEQLMREVGNLKEAYRSEITHVREVHASALAGISRELDALAARTAEQKSDTGKALDAALLSARDAVQLQTEAFATATAKSETATTKQIDALGLLVDRLGGQLDEKINDLKSRTDRLEAAKQGEAASTTEARASSASSNSQTAVIVGIITLVVFGALAALNAIVNSR